MYSIIVEGLLFGRILPVGRFKGKSGSESLFTTHNGVRQDKLAKDRR
jgi:hypothetical protein